MQLISLRRGNAGRLSLPERARRNAVSVSPIAATMLLTAAIFLLPATSDHRPARASVDQISVSSTRIHFDVAARKDAARP